MHKNRGGGERGGKRKSDKERRKAEKEKKLKGFECISLAAIDSLAKGLKETQEREREGRERERAKN
jgi:hypothetical protein